MKKIFLTLSIFIISIINVFAFNFDKLFFSEYSISYSSIIAPSFLENNSTGTLDTPYFSGKLGIDILKWVDIYAGISFGFFVEQANKQNHYTFVPVFGGIKLNLFPDFFIYPSFLFEMGKSISNYHGNKFDMVSKSIKEYDIPWTGDYYNFGISINLILNDIATLVLNIERPGITYYEKDTNEIHIFKSGLGFKILY
jgi:hypothetical protein